MHLTNRGSPGRPCGQLACGSPQDHQTNTGMHQGDLVGIIAFGTPQGSPDTQKVTWETLWAFSLRISSGSPTNTGINQTNRGSPGRPCGHLACGSPRITKQTQGSTGQIEGHLGDLVGNKPADLLRITTTPTNMYHGRFHDFKRIDCLFLNIFAMSLQMVPVRLPELKFYMCTYISVVLVNCN